MCARLSGRKCPNARFASLVVSRNGIATSIVSSSKAVTAIRTDHRNRLLMVKSGTQRYCNLNRFEHPQSGQLASTSFSFAIVTIQTFS